MPNENIRTGLEHIELVKEDIRTELLAKGCDVPDITPFNKYPDIIRGLGPNASNVYHTVVFQYIGQDGEGKCEKYQVLDGTSITVPADFNRNVPYVAHTCPELTMYEIVNSDELPLLSNVKKGFIFQALYYTTTGDTYFCIKNTIDLLKPTINIKYSGGAIPVVDWDDGTAASNTGSHEYAAAGQYLIRVTKPPTGQKLNIVGDTTVMNGRYISGLYDQSTDVSTVSIYYSMCTQGLYLGNAIGTLSVNSFQNTIMAKIFVFRPSYINAFDLTGMQLWPHLKYASPKNNIMTASTVVMAQNTVINNVINSIYTATTPGNYPTIDGNFPPPVIAPRLTGTTTIGDGYMSGKHMLEDVGDIGEGVTTIGINFLNGCARLKRAPTLPSTLLTIGTTFMQNCYDIEDISNVFEKVDRLAWTTSMIRACHSLKKVGKLPKILGTTQGYCFYLCTSLVDIGTIDVSDPSANIGPQFLNNLDKLETVNFDWGSRDTNPATGTPMQVAAGAFTACRSLKISPRFPPYTEFASYGQNLFQNNYSLEVLDLRGLPALKPDGNVRFRLASSDTTTALWNQAFYGCYGIKKVIVDASELAAYQALGWGWRYLANKLATS
ncbi:hypothetical protein AGMMS49995_10400 [Endomicrobiia bacterium]|nr:hypothetical protein AGMMS49995_10400 [Endomicrobiia bacterium]